MNSDVLDMLAEQYLLPVKNDWENNGVTEEFIRGYRNAIERICIKLFGEDSINNLVSRIRGEIDGKVSGSEENM